MTAHSTRPDVWVTGMGMITAVGQDCRETWDALIAGRSGVRPVTRFDTTALRTTIAATSAFLDAQSGTCAERCERLLRSVLEEALAEARLSPDAGGAALVLGLPPLELDWRETLALVRQLCGDAPTDYPSLIATARRDGIAGLEDRVSAPRLAARLAARHGCQGVPVTVNTACASGATALQIGAEMIRDGLADRVLVAAADAPVVPDTILRFSLLGALSMSNALGSGAARPFAADRDGFVLGEGAAALVLESAAAARARGQAPLAVLSGLGESSDTYHLTRSSPDAAAATEAMRRAIADAGLTPEAVGYVNAHGTGTPENDRAEALAMRQVFGEAGAPPISATKAMTGHTLSAAGAVEAAITVLALRQGMLPPTINHARPDPDIALDVVPNVARRAAARHALSNAFGFGGQNVCLLLSLPG